MIGLPKSTEFNKRIPKQKFYENMEISSVIKQIFVEQIKMIYWRNKIAVSTTNLATGHDVTEIEVFEIRLNHSELDERVLRQIDKEIPYHILFLLEYQGKYQAWIGYKEITTSGNKRVKVGKYYHSDWRLEEELHLWLEGLNIDTIYENLVRQIAGDKLKKVTPDESLKESITKDEKKEQLEKQISALTVKIRKEKQLNKQIELNTEVKKLKKNWREQETENGKFNGRT